MQVWHRLASNSPYSFPFPLYADKLHFPPALQMDAAWQLCSGQWSVNGSDIYYIPVTSIKSCLEYSSMLFSFPLDLYRISQLTWKPHVVEDGEAARWKGKISWITPFRRPVHCSGTLILHYMWSRNKPFLIKPWKFFTLFVIAASLPELMQN